MSEFHFVHAADIHLGYEQYNLVDRADDFARAYLGVVKYAVESRAAFVLIAGDLFHRSSADAWMLKQAMHGLEKLRTAGIPVVAVEGNHDAQHAKKHLSWMEFLCHQELLVLLNVDIAPNGHKRMVPFDPVERCGSWVDVAGARIYGMKYYGAATGRYLEEVVGSVEPGPDGFTVLTLHAGMQGQVPHLHGGLTTGQLEPCRPAVDYVALGHVHKRLQEAWIFNPGSTETNSMEEMDWPHGFFDVTVDARREPKFQVQPVPTRGLRPFRRITVGAEGTETLDDLTRIIDAAIGREEDIPAGAVVEIQVGGVAGFNRQELPIERIKSTAEQRFQPLAVRVRNNLVAPGLVPIRHGERMRRSELERVVVGQLVRADAEYEKHAETWTRLVLDIKNMAANRETAPATIADHIGDALCDVDSGTTARAGDDSRGVEQDVAAVTTNGDEPSSEPESGAQAREITGREALELLELGGPLDERLGGEPPCMAHLFEDW